MNKQRDSDENIDGETVAKPSACNLIRRKPASKRSAVNEYQVKLFTQLAEELESAVFSLFNVVDRERIPLERFQEIWRLPEFERFIMGSYACGLVCSDETLNGDLQAINVNAFDLIPTWTFPQLRKYFHLLILSDKWADGYSSPILEAIQSGSLSQAVRHMASDERLYEPYL